MSTFSRIQALADENTVEEIAAILNVDALEVQACIGGGPVPEVPESGDQAPETIILNEILPAGIGRQFGDDVGFEVISGVAHGFGILYVDTGSPTIGNPGLLLTLPASLTSAVNPHTQVLALQDAATGKTTGFASAAGTLLALDRGSGENWDEFDLIYLTGIIFRVA